MVVRSTAASAVFGWISRELRDRYFVVIARELRDRYFAVIGYFAVIARKLLSR
jgi:hypothetical protein